ncbi:hypothetical protein [Arthrobacter monumenti]
MIQLSGKSPQNSKAKKTGKTILEKRADKRAKAESSDLQFVKPRKSRKA